MDYIPETRVFLLFTFRPEFIPPWNLKSYHAQINLNRLSKRQALEMVGYLLNSKDVDIELKKLLFEKTERIPLFLEEFIRSFIDLKLIEKKDKYYLVKNLKGVNIPSTIQHVIMARVDSLPEGTKELAQAGSVIGREFSYELISKVTDFSEEALISHLATLRDSELINERGIFPQSTHIFKHALIRDVVYNSILNRRKKELHKRIGLIIEETHKDKLGEVCEGLAEHYEKCKDFQRAATFLKMSGAKATNSGAMTESVDYARKTVDCLEQLPKSEEVLKKIIDIRTILAIRLMDLNYFHQSKEMINSNWGRQKYAYEYSKNAVSLADESGDLYTRLLAYSCHGVSCLGKGEIGGALKYLSAGLAVAKQIDQFYWRPGNHQFLGDTYYELGDYQESIDHYKEAIRNLERSGNLPSWKNLMDSRAFRQQ